MRKNNGVKLFWWNGIDWEFIGIGYQHMIDGYCEMGFVVQHI